MDNREYDTSESLRILVIDDEPRAEQMMDVLSDSRWGFHCRSCTSVSELESALRDGEWDACLVNESAEQCSPEAVANILYELGLDIPKIIFGIDNKIIRPRSIMQAWSKHIFGDLTKQGSVSNFGKRLETLIYDHEAGDIAGFKRFLSHLAGVACIKEAGGEILYINDYSRKWFNRSPAEVIGCTDMELWPEERAKKIIAEDMKVVKAGEIREAIEEYTVDGEERTFLTIRFPVNVSEEKIVGWLSLDISKRVRAEEKLRKATAELREKHEQLERKGIALREVLTETEEQRDQVKRNIAENLDNTIFPIVDRLEMMCNSEMKPIVEELKTELAQISSPFIRRIKSEFSDLSPRELEVCRLVRRGLSSKEIGSQLNLSPSTIYKYRELIRRKLGLVNQGETLKSYLQNREDLAEEFQREA